VKPIDDRTRPVELSLLDRLGLPGVVRGLLVTVRHFFQQRVTWRYPERGTAPRSFFRGEHVLTVDDEGRIDCVACFLCATACPSRCIEIEAEAAPPEWPRDKRPSVFNIDMLRCIYCGICEEACPVDAIALTDHHPEVAESRAEKIYDKDRLLANNRYHPRADRPLAGPLRGADRPPARPVRGDEVPGEPTGTGDR
jgi:NADH-quinone oxidoreductase subunit I